MTGDVGKVRIVEIFLRSPDVHKYNLVRPINHGLAFHFPFTADQSNDVIVRSLGNISANIPVAIGREVAAMQRVPQAGNLHRHGVTKGSDSLKRDLIERRGRELPGSQRKKEELKRLTHSPPTKDT
jgi:hypothetical protein